MLYIGFTTKYYTLWEATPRKDGYTYYTYIQNLSFDLDKAKAKQPTAIVDLSLRGSKSFRIKSIPQDGFQFGKYRGERFAECDDIDYMVWYHNVLNDEALKSRVRPTLEGYGYVLNDEKMMKEEEVAYYNKLKAAFPTFQAKISNHEVFRFKCAKNVNANGVMKIPFCKITFPTINEKEYNGKKYYLPTQNGYESRIKGFIVAIDEYEADLIGDMEYAINVIKFHVEFNR